MDPHLLVNDVPRVKRRYRRPHQVRRRHKQTDEQKRAAAQNPWIAFVKDFWKQNPHLSYPHALAAASDSGLYRKAKKIKNESS